MNRLFSSALVSFMVPLSPLAMAGAVGAPNGLGSETEPCYRPASRNASPIDAAQPACGREDSSRTVAAAEPDTEDKDLSVQSAPVGDGEPGWRPPVREVRLSDVFELYSSVSFFAVPALHAPSMLLDRVEISDLRRRGIRSLGDYLHMEAPAYELLGAVGQKSGGSGGGVQVGVRGIVIRDSSVKTLVLRDGVPVNSVTKGGYSAGRFMSPLWGDVAHIETAAGPGSIVHGSGAISGFVNMETATAKDRPGLWALAERTAGNGLRTEISLGHTVDIGEDLALFLYAGYAASDGLPTRAFPRALPSIERDCASSERDQRFLQPHWKSTLHLSYGSEESTLQASLLLRYSRTNLAYARRITKDPYDRRSYAAAHVRLIAGLDAFGSQAGTNTNGVLVVPRLELRLSGHEALEVVSSWRRDESSLNASDWLNDIVQDLRIDHRSAKRPYSISELETDRRLRMILRSSRLGAVNVALGGEISRLRVAEDRGDSLFPDPDVDFTATDTPFAVGLSNRTFSGIFGELFGQFGSVSIFLGARLDRAGKMTGRDFYEPLSFDFQAQPVTSFVPRAVITWQMTFDQVFKLGYQEAFRNPTPYDYVSWFSRLIDHNVIHTKYAPRLRPEKAQYLDVAHHIGDLFVPGLSVDWVVSYTINRSTLGGLDWRKVFPGVWEREGDPTQPFWGSEGNEADIIRSIAADVVLTYRWNSVQAKLIYDYSRPVLMRRSAEDTLLTQWDGETWNAFPRHLFKLRISQTVGPCTISMALRRASGILDRGSAETPLTASNQPQGSWMRGFPQWQMDAAVSLQFLPTVHLIAFAKNIGTQTRYRRGGAAERAGSVYPGPDVPLLGLALEYSDDRTAGEP